MTAYITKGPLKIDGQLYQFISEHALPGTQVDEYAFWQGFADLLAQHTPTNTALLEKRDQLQAKIDAFHTNNKQASFAQYKAFLEEIGYLLPAPANSTISTQNVDAEIATIAGPQLVVPINNARYALNAVNARWGSLYDALYGTDAISEENGQEKTKAYNPARGQAVIARARKVLDSIAPLANGSHADAINYCIENGVLQVTLQNGNKVALATPGALVGFNGNANAPSALLLQHNNLHTEIQFDSTHPIGAVDPAGIKDLLMESAITTIMDCEDSVAAVDAEDKTLVYQNWLGLMQGTLQIEVAKGSTTITRSMNADRQYTSLQGEELSLNGRSLMFVRNVGHLMTNDAILFNDSPIYEGIMDGVITSLIAKHDILKRGNFTNSKMGSVYIVKPKMHGPDEVAFTNSLFASIEQLLDLPTNTLKVGIMDEERRTSINLAACIAAASERVVFINTGFLDRTGDEIHTSMLSGAFAPKAELKTRPWIHAYEKANVVTGLQAGLSGKAQIGKGMWPIPDQMQAMLEAKIGHPKAGANTAWVPSPTGATLHALHYHEVNVFDVQATMAQETFNGTDTILDIPLLGNTPLSDEAIQHDLDNNVQGILGYVVRWVHQGIGCSKVPDINNVGLMEDRATLRISSQHIANWLEHGLVSEQQVKDSMLKMASLVDEQNKSDNEYIAMMPDAHSSIGFIAAQELIFKGKEQPNGYTEPLLHAKRREMKAHIANQANK
ncbi:MAG: malate synthase G [Glaciecola sp.]